MKKKRVVIGLLGLKLDATKPRRDRWQAWRPTVGICQQDDLHVDRLELLYEPKSESLMRQVTGDIHAVSTGTQVVPHPMAFRDPWDFEEVYQALHQFSRDYSFDTDAEEYLVHITTGTHVAQICLFLLTESRHLPAALAQTSPPRRKAESPSGSLSVIDLDLSRYDQLATRFSQEHLEAESVLKAGIETKDKSFNELIGRIEQVTLATKAPILLSGPTGAGKTQLAKRIFQLRRSRKQVGGDLVEVNCATIRGDQTMSTLFGHTKGAFTGAIAARPGLLKAADGGVLFLDEIGELGLDEQAMLLRAIEDKTFLPVGSDQATSSDFQLIAGTNRDLATEVARGRFREDLLARINLWSFRLPGLAERRDDIDPNIDFELQRYTQNSGNKVTMNKEARQRFLDFACDPSTPWRASFRDLNAAITRMATLANSGRITRTEVDEEVERLRDGWIAFESPDGPPDDVTGVLTSMLSPEQVNQMDRFDRVQLAEVIRVCRESRSLADAGRTLFSESRKAKQRPNDSDRLKKYLAKHGLAWCDF